MKNIKWPALPVAVTAALLTATSGWAQMSNTISAKPGALNYIEGTVLVNDNPVADKAIRSTSLSTNDRLTTESGKAEVLLTPGVFARVGSDSEIRMVSPSLTDTQLELVRGELMVEATGLLKENNLQILDHGSITQVKKNGLYRFTADNPPLVAVLDGKAEVNLNDQKVDLKKGRKTILADNSLKAEKFDVKAKDDLYAWSDVRSQYDSAASFRSAQTLSSAGLGAYGYGFAGSSGWFWNSAFNSYAWIPGSGYFYNPFGYGFYSPGFVGLAPVVIAPGRGYGYPGRVGYWNRPAGVAPGSWHSNPGAHPGAWHGNPGAWHGNPGTHPTYSGAAHPGFGGGGGGGRPAFSGGPRAGGVAGRAH